MPLDFTGQQVNTESGTNYQARDGDKVVVVKASGEALHDYGEAAVLDKASEKYDDGQIGPDSIVVVRTTDFI